MVAQTNAALLPENHLFLSQSFCYSLKRCDCCKMVSSFRPSMKTETFCISSNVFSSQIDRKHRKKKCVCPRSTFKHKQNGKKFERGNASFQTQPVEKVKQLLSVLNGSVVILTNSEKSAKRFCKGTTTYFSVNSALKSPSYSPEAFQICGDGNLLPFDVSEASLSSHTSSKHSVYGSQFASVKRCGACYFGNLLTNAMRREVSQKYENDYPTSFPKVCKSMQRGTTVDSLKLSNPRPIAASRHLDEPFISRSIFLDPLKTHTRFPSYYSDRSTSAYVGTQFRNFVNQNSIFVSEDGRESSHSLKDEHFFNTACGLSWPYPASTESQTHPVATASSLSGLGKLPPSYLAEAMSASSCPTQKTTLSTPNLHPSSSTLRQDAPYTPFCDERKGEGTFKAIKSIPYCRHAARNVEVVFIEMPIFPPPMAIAVFVSDLQGQPSRLSGIALPSSGPPSKDKKNESIKVIITDKLYPRENGVAYDLEEDLANLLPGKSQILDDMKSGKMEFSSILDQTEECLTTEGNRFAVSRSDYPTVSRDHSGCTLEDEEMHSVDAYPSGGRDSPCEQPRLRKLVVKQSFGDSRRSKNKGKNGENLPTGVFFWNDSYVANWFESKKRKQYKISFKTVQYGNAIALRLAKLARSRRCTNIETLMSVISSSQINPTLHSSLHVATDSHAAEDPFSETHGTSMWPLQESPKVRDLSEGVFLAPASQPSDFSVSREKSIPLLCEKKYPKGSCFSVFDHTSASLPLMPQDPSSPWQRHLLPREPPLHDGKQLKPFDLAMQVTSDITASYFGLDQPKPHLTVSQVEDILYSSKELKENDEMDVNELESLIFPSPNFSPVTVPHEHSLEEAPLPSISSEMAQSIVWDINVYKVNLSSPYSVSSTNCNNDLTLNESIVSKPTERDSVSSDCFSSTYVLPEQRRDALITPTSPDNSPTERKSGVAETCDDRTVKEKVTMTWMISQPLYRMLCMPYEF
ncbi:AP2 domain transcription factor AP2XII-6 [Cardiosporidium cionae]|uniref:AP2 domain transcription factor AP2XII-6 n=1 Tax=Cardiosporidium cionae TaxID=476202 RepID=A0ABQ7JB33_9APIC|nr:AP2 domain transcription factor AP2XII-6 [Cardiosporidium cionae]|eukprot:KAF8821213.1 AP2 domain transcription factor AP2XII-6 [Cardiosporidium cionae]